MHKCCFGIHGIHSVFGNNTLLEKYALGMCAFGNETFDKYASGIFLTRYSAVQCRSGGWRLGMKSTRSRSRRWQHCLRDSHLKNCWCHKVKATLQKVTWVPACVHQVRFWALNCGIEECNLIELLLKKIMALNGQLVSFIYKVIYMTQASDCFIRSVQILNWLKFHLYEWHPNLWVTNVDRSCRVGFFADGSKPDALEPYLLRTSHGVNT